ncbi:glycoside hydrolase family 2 [Flavihumibacter sp. R14]|nr:glycoside hydrolase family 2 [Flavihumibacter soli]
MVKSLKFFFACSLCCWMMQVAAQEKLSLAGRWNVKLDSQNEGVKQKWFTQEFEKAIQLPGTLDDAGIGEKTSLSDEKMEKEVVLKLARKHSYIGPAWYSKEITIPQNWKEKNIRLSLERVIWNTRIWIDGKEAGSDESLSAPHRFDLTSFLSPGKHLMVIRIDNSKQHEISHRNMGHAYTDGTQIIWNGIIGKIELVAQQKLRINLLQTYPKLDDRSVTISAALQNDHKTQSKGTLLVHILDSDNKIVASQKLPVTIPAGEFHKKIKLSLGQKAKLWDEFNPNLYTAKVILSGSKSGETDAASTTFGLREITGRNSLLQVNGNRVFLRGSLECSIFPLTGYPPMDKQGWLKVFKTAKEYGLNHIRFHSWCPPEAAFEVADSLGFYLQAELPFWNENVGESKTVIPFLKDEAKRIREEYGNHPSFVLWSLGNELRGDFAVLDDLYTEVKGEDKRHLYATTTFTFEKGHGRWPEKADEFFVTQYTTKGWVRGQGIFNTYTPDFSTDYSKAVDSLPVPIITHEIGQYSVYPNLEEISKYTGVLDPLNFKAIRHDLMKKGMADLAPSYTLASGKFSASLYKEEIERALRTKGMSGFQLLDLHDFPGQGTATVGILDAFWDSKGLVTPLEHRMYCSPVVPLIRFDKASYFNTEQVHATAEIANFGSSQLKQVVPVWKVSGKNGRLIFNGELAVQDIPVGNGISLGSFGFDLKQLERAEELTIELQIKGTAYKNQWKIWVYPQQKQNGNKVIFTSSVKEAISYLAEGSKVILNPDTAFINGVEGRFAPVFWSPVHFPKQPGTMGILCDPQHRALDGFPTDFYSNWQWWDLIKNSKTMIIDSLPPMKPIVRVIDNFFKNRKMALVIEAKVGKGKLLLVSTDIRNNLESRPAAGQLRSSLVKYAESEDFSPELVLDEVQLKQLFINPSGK